MKWMILPLKKYARFSGRSRRVEYWMFALFMVIVYALFIAALVATGFSQPDVGSSLSAASVILFFSIGIFWLAMLIPSLAVQVRRLHDTDRSGGWILLWVGPMVLYYILEILSFASPNPLLAIIGGIVSLSVFLGSLVLLVLFCLPSTHGANRFGPDPFGDTSESLAKTFE